VAFDNPFEAGVRLAGTLTLPKGAGPFPAAILISGSGANDRDDTTLGHKPFAVIADQLTRRGFAVLRYDDRGVGGSKGDRATADSVDFATDANAAFRYLAGRPEVRRGAIGFIGHSEGGVTAPLAMASNKDVAFLVMLAGPGVRWERVVLSQWRMSGRLRGKSQEELDRTGPMVDAVYRAVGGAKSEDAAVTALRPLLTPEALAAMGVPASVDKDTVARQMSSRWGRYLFAYDPAPNLRKIRVPVLAMGGSLDQQIPSDENLPAIKAALVSSKDVTVKEFPGLNHMFQTAKTGAVGEYADIQETFAPAALTFMSDWLASRFIRN
jgi:pimeloyl-ACP methyl ester carboxylesterase